MAGDRQLPEPEEQRGADEESAPVTEGRERAGLAGEVELNPLSLVGSYFHRLEGGVIIWDGLVVGEPQPGMYLLNVRKGLNGLDRSEAQVIVPLSAMLAVEEGDEFRFFDSRDAMIEAYAEYVVAQEVA